MLLIKFFQACMVNISENTFALKEEGFDCEYGSEIEANNMGKLKMYFVYSQKIKNAYIING